MLYTMGPSLFLVAILLLQREITAEGQSQAQRQIEEELQADRKFLEMGVDRLGGKSTTEQHAAFVYTTPEAVRIRQDHRKRLLEFISRQGDAIDQQTGNTASSTCPPEPTCDTTAVFRTADGSCNNLENPSWGKSFIPMRRFIPAEYNNGLFTPKDTNKDGEKLKSAREISRVLHLTDSRPTARSSDISHMTMQWGQFLDHDLSLTPLERGADTAAITCCDEDIPDAAKDAGITVSDRPQCYAITIPPGDRRFAKSCMNFVRSIQVDNADCNVAPVEQLNQPSAYIDGSQVYGSSNEEQLELRTFQGGLLKTSSQDPQLLPRNSASDCVTSDAPNFCFLAGDPRVDEHMGLASMHTIWLREHNRIATELARINSHWDDERVFQETRRIVGAMLQHITYTEFLPVVLSSTHRRRHNLASARFNRYSRLYNTKVDASIRNAFATAAYRFGHSMIRSTFTQASSGCKYAGNIHLRDSFGNTSIILSSNGRAVDSLTRGLTRDPAMNVDQLFSPEVTDFLFMDENGNSLDLVALNVQRGRDHGLAGYNKWREWCGLSTASNFGTRRGGLVDHSSEVAKALEALYSNPDDIDLFSGGVSERPVRGGLVGPTFSCIISRQFEALKMGDRYWYETGDTALRFTPAQLREIRRANLARVICDNTDTSRIQPRAFMMASFRNMRTRCTSFRIRRMNLNRFRERSTSYGR